MKILWILKSQQVKPLVYELNDDLTVKEKNTTYKNLFLINKKRFCQGKPLFYGLNKLTFG